MWCAGNIHIAVLAALPRGIRIIHYPGIPMLCFRTRKTHPGAAISAKNDAWQPMRVRSIRQSFRATFPKTLCLIPCFLVNDGFMGISKNYLFFRCGCSAFFQLEVFTNTFAQHCMPKILLTVKNISDGGSVPAIRIVIRMALCSFWTMLFFIWLAPIRKTHCQRGS